MYKFIQIQRFAKRLFDTDQEANKASEIMLGILTARSPRISRIADAMPGGYEANYKMIQRFLKGTDLKRPLQRFFDQAADFVIGDPTEIERAHAWKTDYVGHLSAGDRRGFWLLVLATPFRGRALPFNFVTYSSATLGHSGSSRNIEHQRVINPMSDVIGDRPLVLDREFSYLELFRHLAASQMNFVIRLNQGYRPPKFYYDQHKREELSLLVSPDSAPKIYRHIYYKGEVKVNVIGFWKSGMPKPLWVITNIDPDRALDIYLQRMKIEMEFRDLKSIFQANTIMNKSKLYLDQMIALLLLSYAIALMVGEAIRDVRYADISPDQWDFRSLPPCPPNSPWFSYSGIFVLLRQKRILDHRTLRKLVSCVFSSFSLLVSGDPVRSFVPT